MVVRWVKMASLLFAVVMVVGGCGGGLSPSQQSSRRQPSIRGSSFPQELAAASRVSVVEIDNYKGWAALRMSNGLVTVVAVPAIGGRIMEYKLGNHPFLWTNPAEYGKTNEPPASEDDRQWHNFGGYKAWPAPQEQWGGPPDPLGSELDGGKWAGKITNRGGPIGEIEMVSPPDENVTGLQITRRVQMFAGTTRVLVTEPFKNVSAQPITWSIWGLAQVPGSLTDRDKFNEEARIYLPLNPDSRDPNGFWYLSAKKDEAKQQFEVLDEGKLMQVSYHYENAKIGADSGADSGAGWIAYVDGIHEYAFVQRFGVSRLGDYPDKGATVEVWTSGEDSYMEMEVLSPLYTLQPDEQKSFEQEWYATCLGGPIRDTTEVAAIREPLSLASVEAGLRLTGEFGVFAPGKVEIVLLDQGGEQIGEAITSLAAKPTRAMVLDRTLSPEPGAVAVSLRLVSERGAPIGEVARVPLAAKTAQIPGG